MKLKLPPPRYRVIEDSFAGYESQYRPWWYPAWSQCSRDHGGSGVNTSPSIEKAKQLCANHLAYRIGRINRVRVVAQFSARALGVRQ